jgi:rare lipoprotein A
MKKHNIIVFIGLLLTFATTVNAALPETGSAAYYNNSFQGKPTTSGEPYDAKLFTAAHKTLPLGTLVRVTRSDNNKSVVVRINDRLPASKKNTVIDLSLAAAEAIDLLQAGRTQVSVDLAEKPIVLPARADNGLGKVPPPSEKKATQAAPVVNSTTVSDANIDKASSLELGTATYYSNAFQGKKTSSGEAYDASQLTAAHKKLAFGTLVRVTRLDNKKSVVVRINDRIPAKKEGVAIDLSYAAAETLDLIEAGKKQVKIEVVDAKSVEKVTAAPKTTGKVITPSPAVKPTAKPTTNSTGSNVTLAPKGITASPANAAPVGPTQPATNVKQGPTKPPKPTVGTWQISVKKAPEKGFAVQLMVLTNADLILAETAKIEAKFPGKVIVKEGPDDAGNPQYKILIGAYGDRKAAEAAQKNATKKGFSKCYVVELK